MFSMVAVFGVPAVVANYIVMLINIGTAGNIISSAISGLMTGGTTLIATAGIIGVKAFLKQKLLQMGKVAFIAW